MTLKSSTVLLWSLVLLVVLVGWGVWQPDPSAQLVALAAESGPSENLIVPLLVRSPWPLNTEILHARGDDGDCYWYDWADDKYYYGCPENVRPPTYWSLFWKNRQPCWPGSAFVTGQPEARLTDRLDDVGRGEAALWFTFWRCQNVRMYQVLPEGLWGKRAKVTARVQVWYSDCSEKSFGPPLHKDCVTPWSGELEVRVGVASEASIWKDDAYCWGEPCWHEIVSPWIDVPVTGGAVWIETRSDYPAKHENVYVESFVLEVQNE